MVVALLALTFSAFQTDARLDKPVGITEWATTAPKVCADLAKLTGAPISCDPSLRDDLLVLVVKHRPAREIMAKIAGTFGWQFLPVEGGYRLTPTEGFVRRVGAGRAQVLAEEGERLQAAIREYIATIRKQDSSALRKQMQELQQAMMSHSAVPMDADDPASPWKKMNELGQRLNPVTLIALSALSDLSRDQIGQLVDRRIVAAVEPVPLEISIGAEGAKAVTDCIETLKNPPANSGDFGGNAYTLSIGSSFPQPPDTRRDVLTAVVQLDSWTQVNANLITKEGVIASQASISLPKPKFPPLSDFSLPLSQALLATPTEASGASASTKPDAEADELAPFAQWLDGAARKLNCDVVSDAYDDYYRSLMTRKLTAARLTDARNDGFDPTIEGGWLTNRNRKWPRYREEQAPRDILRALGSPIELHSLDEQAAIASRFTVAQVQSPLAPIGLTDYWFYRFWTELLPPVREALRAGKHVRLRDLPDSVVALLYELGESPSEDSPIDENYGQIGVFAEGEFVNYDRLLTQTHPEPGGDFPPSSAFVPRLNDFAVLYPAQIDPESTVWIQRAEIPAIFDADGPVVYAPGDIATAQEEPFDINAHLKLAQAHALRFHFELKKGVDVRQDVSELTVGEDITHDRTKWPADILDRIRKRKEFEKAMQGPGNTTPPPR
jgi:hypothetical protein